MDFDKYSEKMVLMLWLFIFCFSFHAFVCSFTHTHKHTLCKTIPIPNWTFNHYDRLFVQVIFFWFRSLWELFSNSIHRHTQTFIRSRTHVYVVICLSFAFSSLANSHVVFICIDCRRAQTQFLWIVIIFTVIIAWAHLSHLLFRFIIFISAHFCCKFTQICEKKKKKIRSDGKRTNEQNSMCKKWTKQSKHKHPHTLYVDVMIC